MHDSVLDVEIKEQLQNLKQEARLVFNIELTEQHLASFLQHTLLLLEWNERMNLTTITKPDEIMRKHFLDSLVFEQWIRLRYASDKLCIGDLGTGAGFPGIPIQILRPESQVVLMDSLAKRISFLDAVISQLRLTKIQAVHTRAEDIGHDPSYRQSFDVVTARAVAELPVLLEYALPLLKVGGYLLAAKGIDPEGEVRSSENALKQLRGKVEKVEQYRLAEGADHRSLIVVKKIAQTPDRFPRQAGKPKKNPL